MGAQPPYNQPNPYNYQQPGYSQPPGGDGPPPGYPPSQPPRQSKTWLWVLGVIGAMLVVIFCCVGGILLSGGLGLALFANTASDMTGANATARGYYDEVQAHNWTRAQGYLSSTLKPSVTTTTLQTYWSAVEIANGTVSSFTITNTNISTNNGKTTATITGTLRYSQGKEETKVLNLVKEGSDWKLNTAP